MALDFWQTGSEGLFSVPAHADYVVPGAGWTPVEKSVAPVPIGSSRVFVQKATLTKDSERRVVFYWYLWPDIDRDPEQSVLTMCLHIPVVTTDEDAVAAGADFLRTLSSHLLKSLIGGAWFYTETSLRYNEAGSRCASLLGVMEAT